jgi:hypothetical protein
VMRERRKQLRLMEIMIGWYDRSSVFFFERQSSGHYKHPRANNDIMDQSVKGQLASRASYCCCGMTADINDSAGCGRLA